MENCLDTIDVISRTMSLFVLLGPESSCFTNDSAIKETMWVTQHVGFKAVLAALSEPSPKYIAPSQA